MKLPSVRLPRISKSLALKLAVIPIVASLLVMAALQFGVIHVHAENPTLSQEQDEIMSGLASFELNPANATNSAHPKNFTPKGSDACSTTVKSNVKVNQNCVNLSDPDLLGRGQAQNETSMAIDPNSPNHLVASYNDYRRGDGTCGVSTSTDNGRNWSDSTVPNGFTRGNGPGESNFGASREYWQAGGDTSVAFDTKGNAYLSCQLFNRGKVGSHPTTPNPDASSAFVVFRSTGNGGASWNFPGHYAAVFANVSGSHSARVELLDKQLMTVDNHAGSPFQDRIYVTWTEFASDGSAFIYETYSSDYGQTFSGRHLVSQDSALCPNNYGAGTTSVTGSTTVSPGPTSNCNENQFSDPFTGPDGALYVTFTNFNNGLTSPSDNRNQFLLAKSTDGGNTFSAPVKVSDFFDLPDCATYQGSDLGRACVPEKGTATNSVFRATNYSSGAVNPTNPSQIAITFGSYINRNDAAGCTPNSFSHVTGNNLFNGVKSSCNNAILISVSNNGGTSFTGTSADVTTLPTVGTDPGQAATDQFWQWEAFTKDGKLAVSYYDRQYGDDETTGSMDMSLSGSKDLVNFGVQRATSSSMPLPTDFPDANGNSQFFGDYSGLAAYNDAHPLWMDTRDSALFDCGTTPPAVCNASLPNGLTANDEDIFTVGMGVPTK